MRRPPPLHYLLRRVNAMAGGQWGAVLRFMHSAANPAGSGEPADGELLRRFLATRDEDAFAELVRRHGPLVYGVCRRRLHAVHDAEDAFQATFLVLARRAGSVTK